MNILLLLYNIIIVGIYIPIGKLKIVYIVLNVSHLLI